MSKPFTDGAIRTSRDESISGVYLSISPSPSWSPRRSSVIRPSAGPLGAAEQACLARRDQELLLTGDPHTFLHAGARSPVDTAVMPQKSAQTPCQVNKYPGIQKNAVAITSSNFLFPLSHKCAGGSSWTWQANSHSRIPRVLALLLLLLLLLLRSCFTDWHTSKNVWTQPEGLQSEV